MGLHRLTIISTAAGDVAPEAVDAMAAELADLSLHTDVGGVLFYNGVNFLHAIEGDRRALDAVLDRIKSDRRCSGVIVLATEPIGERSLARGWELWSAAMLSGDRPIPSALQPFVEGFSKLGG